jgi:hypothetical protein
MVPKQTGQPSIRCPRYVRESSLDGPVHKNLPKIARLYSAATAEGSILADAEAPALGDKGNRNDDGKRQYD